MDKNQQDPQALWQSYSAAREPSVRNQLVLHYSYIVKCIAIKTVGRYQYFNDMDDIINEGLIALLDAVEKFDSERKVKFETFASIKVRGAMIDFIRRQDCFPRRLKRIAKMIHEADAALSLQFGRAPTNEEIAQHLNVSLSQFEKMQAETCVLTMLSFEEMVYEKGAEDLGIRSGASEVEGPEQAMSEKELQQILTENIENLSEKEKLVIALYYKEQLKIKEISSIMGISDSRVSQIHSSALHKLKQQMHSYMTL